jgi:hypothetical protein
VVPVTPSYGQSVFGMKRQDPFNTFVVVVGKPWYVEGRRPAGGCRDMELLFLSAPLVSDLVPI